MITVIMNSCITTKVQTTVVPKAFSSISKIHYIDESDLKLAKDSYQILKTETAEAAVYYEENKRGTECEIAEVNGEFKLKFLMNPTLGNRLDSHEGIIKYGTLVNDYSNFEYEPYSLAAGLATYRLINSVQDQGADAVIEPIITVKVGQEDRKIIYTATISAKLIKIKTK